MRLTIKGIILIGYNSLCVYLCYLLLWPTVEFLGQYLLDLTIKFFGVN